jgi:hypothetical protein
MVEGPKLEDKNLTRKLQLISFLLWLHLINIIDMGQIKKVAILIHPSLELGLANGHGIAGSNDFIL